MASSPLVNEIDERRVQNSPAISGIQIEVFVNEYLSNGLNNMEAYKVAFGRFPTKVGANEFLRRKDVRSMVALKNKELSYNSVITKLDLLDELNEIKGVCRGNPNPINIANWIKAIELQSKMLGHNEPEKIDVRLQQAVMIDFGLESPIDIEPDDTED
jgi:hypothetical protein